MTTLLHLLHRSATTVERQRRATCPHHLHVTLLLRESLPSSSCSAPPRYFPCALSVGRATPHCPSCRRTPHRRWRAACGDQLQCMHDTSRGWAGQAALVAGLGHFGQFGPVKQSWLHGPLGQVRGLDIGPVHRLTHLLILFFVYLNSRNSSKLRKFIDIHIKLRKMCHTPVLGN
jgi:hypothetical protein